MLSCPERCWFGSGSFFRSLLVEVFIAETSRQGRKAPQRAKSCLLFVQNLKHLAVLAALAVHLLPGSQNLSSLLVSCLQRPLNRSTVQVKKHTPLFPLSRPTSLSREGTFSSRFGRTKALSSNSPLCATAIVLGRGDDRPACVPKSLRQAGVCVLIFSRMHEHVVIALATMQ